MADKIWTVGAILNWTGQYFRDKGLDSPRLDAEVLLSSVLKKDRIFLYVHFDEPLMAEELAAYKALIKRRVAREPVAYILGHREFMKLDFKVDRSVLVPRPDTEILVQAVLDRLPEGGQRVADIGTGSGAIAISLAYYRPELRVTATDISAAALAVAGENAAALGVAERVEFAEGNLLEPLTGKYAAVVSNPPYVSKADMEALMPEVKNWEPHGALYGGPDGLDFYRQLAKESGNYLEPGGLIALEVGLGEAALAAGMLEENGFSEIEIKRDYAGIERVVMGRRS